MITAINLENVVFKDDFNNKFHMCNLIAKQYPDRTNY